MSYVVDNAGQSGDTSGDGLTRLDVELGDDIALFFLALGANDGLREVPVSTMESNLQAIIDQVRVASPDAVVVIAGMIVLDHPNSAYAEEFAQAFPALATRNGATLMPFLLEGVYGNDALYLSDGLHPNSSGHQVLAENVWSVIFTLL